MAEYQAFLKSQALLFPTPQSAQNTPTTGSNTTSLGSLQPRRGQISDWPRSQPERSVEESQPFELRHVAADNSSRTGTTTKLVTSPEERMAEYQVFLKSREPLMGPPQVPNSRPTAIVPTPSTQKAAEHRAYVENREPLMFPPQSPSAQSTVSGTPTLSNQEITKLVTSPEERMAEYQTFLNKESTAPRTNSADSAVGPVHSDHWRQHHVSWQSTT